MLQVALVPPEDVARALEPFRRLHDPAFHRHAPRIALTPAFDGPEDDALARRFDAFRAPSALVAFGPPSAHGEALVLPVLDEARRVAALSAALRDAVLPASARLLADAGPPSLRIGLFAGAAERELARRSFEAAVPRVPAFVARDVVLLLEDARGLWHEVRRTALSDPL